MTRARSRLAGNTEWLPSPHSLATKSLIDPVTWLVVILLAALVVRLSFDRLGAESLLLVAGPVLGWRSALYRRRQDGSVSRPLGAATSNVIDLRSDAQIVSLRPLEHSESGGPSGQGL